MDKVVALIDMDCFYVQVEERDNPHIKGQPAAVVTHNAWKGGGIIAVNYEARAYGVKRGMYGAEAKEICPSIHLVQVPVQREKTDLTKYRNAGKEVITILCEVCNCVERASIDEAYIDLTEVIAGRINEKSISSSDLLSSWVVGYGKAEENEDKESLRVDSLACWLAENCDESEDMFDTSPDDGKSRSKKQLATGALICEEIRSKIYEKTGFKCSAGISSNKMLGKLACGLHKPNQQTILPMESVPFLWCSTPIGKVRNLGGKLGDSLVREFGCKTMADVSALSLQELRARYDDKTASWLFGLGKGIDNECIVSRQLTKSIGCGKNFMGKEALKTKDKVHKWMTTLAEELSERLEEDAKMNKRRAKTLTVGVRLDGEERNAVSRSCPLPSVRVDSIVRSALSLIQNYNTSSSKQSSWVPSLKNISLSASKFEDTSCIGTVSIESMFKKASDDPPLHEKKIEQRICPLPVQGISTPIREENKTIKSFFERVILNKDKMNAATDINKEMPSTSFAIESLSSDKDDIDKESDDNLNYLVSCLIAEDGENDADFEASTDSDSSIEIIHEDKISANNCTEKEADLMKQIEELNSKESDSVSVDEIFPDINAIDESLLSNLPKHLREKVRVSLEAREAEKVGREAIKNCGISKFIKDTSENGIERKFINSSKQEDSTEKVEENACGDENSLVKCCNCGREIKLKALNEHMDYHLAVSLREKQFEEAKLKLSNKLPAISSKMKVKKRKIAKKTLECQKIRKIDSFFKR